MTSFSLFSFLMLCCEISSELFTNKVAQSAHDVRTMLLRRHFDVSTSLQRPYNVVLKSCAGWKYGQTTAQKNNKKNNKTPVFCSTRFFL